MDTSNTGKLRQAILLAIENDPAATEAKVAHLIQTREASLLLAWARERLAVLIRQQMRRKQPKPEPGPYQMFLEGFGSLTERLPLPGRGRVTLAMATIVDLRRSLKMTRLKAREKARRTASLIEEMEPYAKTRRGLTVERYCELRAAGVKPRISKGAAKNLFDEDEP